MLWMSISQIFNNFTIAFIYCEFGERLGIGFSDSYGIMCQFEWHSFPIEIQRMLPNVMIIAQQPSPLHNLGSFTYSRETYKKVSLIHKITTNVLLERNLSCVFSVDFANEY